MPETRIVQMNKAAASGLIVLHTNGSANQYATLTVMLIVGVLLPGNIYCHIRMGTALCQCGFHGDFIVLSQWETRPPAP